MCFVSCSSLFLAGCSRSTIAAAVAVAAAARRHLFDIKCFFPSLCACGAIAYACELVYV